MNAFAQARGTCTGNADGANERCSAHSPGSTRVLLLAPFYRRFPAGVEPATDRLQADCSTKLSYGMNMGIEPILQTPKVCAFPLSKIIGVFNVLRAAAYASSIFRTRAPVRTQEPQPLPFVQHRIGFDDIASRAMSSNTRNVANQIEFGWRGGIRTHNRRVKSPLLGLLSFAPVNSMFGVTVGIKPRPSHSQYDVLSLHQGHHIFFGSGGRQRGHRPPSNPTAFTTNVSGGNSKFSLCGSRTTREVAVCCNAVS